MSRISPEEIEKAIETLSQAFVNDPDLAHGWHCNIAVPIEESGASHEVANKAASSVMKHIFGVKTSNDMLNSN